MAHRGGGGTGGTQSLGPGPPPWVRGLTYKKKNVWAPDPNPHTAAKIRKEIRLPLASPPRRQSSFSKEHPNGVKTT